MTRSSPLRPVARTLPPAVVAVLLLLSGCFADRSVPETSKLSCESGDDCPDRWSCRNALCVPPSAGLEGPDLEGAAVITPPALREGEVVVTFATDAELSSAPEVQASAEGQAPLAFTSAAAPGTTDKRHWVARRTIVATDPEGTYTLRARVTGTDTLAATRTLGELAIDRTAPQWPRFDHLVVAFDWVDRWVPTSERLVRVRGLAGATDAAGTVRLWADEQTSTSLATGSTTAALGFDALESRGAGLLRPFLSLTDLAGNESDRVPLPAPDRIGFTAPGGPTTYFRPDQPPTLLFQAAPVGGFEVLSDPTFAQRSRAGREQALLPGNTGQRSSWTVSLPKGAAEGLAALSLRAEVAITGVYAEGSTYAAGSLVFDVDGTPPTVDTGKLVFEVTDDGPLLSGIAGAVVDKVGTDVPEYVAGLQALLMESSPIVPGSGQPVAVPIGSDGRFGPVNLLDVPSARVLEIRDRAGNVASFSMPVPADRTPPEISGLQVDASSVRVGDTVRGRFRVRDADSLLRGGPKVWIAGRPARVTGTPGPVGTESSFEFEGEPATEAVAGASEVLVFGEDERGNRRYARAPLTVDATAPTVKIDRPIAGSRWSGEGGAHGTAADDGPLTRVEWALRERTGGKYWNGSAFAGTSPDWKPADGLSRWKIETLPITGCGACELQVRAVDLAGRVQAAPALVPFDEGSGPPQPPSGVSARADGEKKVVVEWSEDATVPHVVHYRRLGDTTWSGTGATQGPSPLAIASGRSIAITGLARGRWEFCVARSSGGVEGPCSPSVSAPSRAWQSAVVRPATSSIDAYAAFGDTQLVFNGRVTANDDAVFKRTGSGAWTSVLKMPVTYEGDRNGSTVRVERRGQVLVASWTYRNTPPHHFAAVSTDLGESWSTTATPGQRIPVGMRHFFGAGDALLALCSLANAEGLSEMFGVSSRDGGRTWANRNLVQNLLSSPPIPSDASGSVGALQSGAVVTVLDRNAQARTADAGLTWVAIHTAASGGRAPTAQQIVHAGDGVLFALDAGSLVWSSRDAGLSFALEPLIPPGLAMGLVRTRTGVLAAGNQQSFFRPDGGEWELVGAASGGNYVGTAGGEAFWQASGVLGRCADDCGVRSPDSTLPFATTAEGRLLPLLGDAVGYVDASFFAAYGPY